MGCGQADTAPIHTRTFRIRQNGHPHAKTKPTEAPKSGTAVTALLRVLALIGVNSPACSRHGDTALRQLLHRGAV